MLSSNSNFFRNCLIRQVEKKGKKLETSLLAWPAFSPARKRISPKRYPWSNDNNKSYNGLRSSRRPRGRTREWMTRCLFRTEVSLSRANFVTAFPSKVVWNYWLTNRLFGRWRKRDEVGLENEGVLCRRKKKKEKERGEGKKVAISGRKFRSHVLSPRSNKYRV